MRTLNVHLQYLANAFDPLQLHWNTILRVEVFARGPKSGNSVIVELEPVTFGYLAQPSLP